jgi:hypothetical protein
VCFKKTFLIENSGVNLLKEICENKFDIIKTRECCEADIFVRPIKSIIDNWLQIQLKVTNQKLNSFFVTRKYSNMLILLIHINDKKFWLFEPNEIGIGKMTIGKNRSKYDGFEIKNICDSFDYWYKKQIYNIAFEKGNTPQSERAKLEYEFVKHREDKINFLNFIDNKMDGQVYDFKINHLKIQEKVCTVLDNGKNFVSLHKSNGYINKKQLRQPYYECDNDFYWFNGRDKKIFYVISEKILINKGYISTEYIKGKR